MQRTCIYTTQGVLDCISLRVNMHNPYTSIRIESFVNTPNDEGALNLPQGSYLETCKDCDVGDGGLLACHCKNYKGTFHKMKTTIHPKICNRIRNVNGILLCE